MATNSDEGVNMLSRGYRDATQFIEVADEGIPLGVDDSDACRDFGSR